MTLSGMPTAVKFQCVKDGVADGEPRSFSDVLAAFADMSGVTIDDQNCPDPSTYP